MKKTLTVIFSAIILGIIFALYVFRGARYTFAKENVNNAVGYQIGVYKLKENAENEIQKYPSSIIIKDSEFYRVYIAIAINEKVQNAFDNILKKNNIDYYKKPLQVSKKCLNRINKFEQILMKSLNNETYINASKETLKIFKDECND